jgi:hypothetical protein
MKRLLTRYVTSVLSKVSVPLTLFLSCLLLLAPLAASTVSLCEFYFCRLIGKALGTGIPKEREEDKRREV